MSTPRSCSSFLMLLLCAAVSLSAPASAQQGSSAPAADKPAEGGSSKPAGSHGEASSAKTPLTPEEKKRADLQADTEKLYKLTQELKAEVAKSNKDTLSVPVVKKAQEIERLAKSIKERSRN